MAEATLRSRSSAVDEFTASNTRTIVLVKIAEFTDKEWAGNFFKKNWPRWYGKEFPSSADIIPELEHQNIMVSGQERFNIGFTFSEPSLAKIIAHIDFNRHNIKAGPLKKINEQNRKLMPRPLDYFPKHLMLVREFFPGESLHLIIKNCNLTRRHLEMTAGILRQLHSIKEYSSFSKRNPLLKFLFANLKRSKRLNLALYPILNGIIKTAFGALDKLPKGPVALCHGDLAPSNVIIAKNETRLIDWDLAHQNDPTYDLAYFSAHLAETMTIKEISEQKVYDARNLFLEAYSSDFSKKRFLAWEALMLAVIVDHLLQSYCYDHLKERMDFMMTMARKNLALL